MTPAEYRKIIAEKIPVDAVVTRHNESGHFYEVAGLGGKVLPSVTAKLQILKDESLIEYKKNRALDYVFANWTGFTSDNVMEHLERASNVSSDNLRDAGDIGTRIHKYREDFFNKWIVDGARPESAISFIPADEADIRATSAMRALDQFCTDWDYTPVISELFVYDGKLGVAGTLDDIGICRRMIKEPKKGNTCVKRPRDPHPSGSLQRSLDPKTMKEGSGDVSSCVECGAIYVYELCLTDLKTSNQFKDHYFFQVALYYTMFQKLTGLEVPRCFILKLSKTDGIYKIEDLKKPDRLARYARHMLKTNEALEFIRGLRKDNQKRVIKV